MVKREKRFENVKRETTEKEISTRIGRAKNVFFARRQKNAPFRRPAMHEKTRFSVGTKIKIMDNLVSRLLVLQPMLWKL